MDKLFARAVDEADFARLIALLDAHGARGFGHGSASDFSEIDRWNAARTIFVCLPSVVVEMRPGRGYVPLLRAFLAGMGIEADKIACLVLKGVCEQLVQTDARTCAALGIKPLRKYGVADLRQQGHYRRIRNDQNNRCATCGVPLGGDTEVELDHLIPFSLIGDVADGSNWRLLCKKCNFGKHEFLSAWLSPDSWNWVSPRVVPAIRHHPTDRARYALFASKPNCEYPDCGVGPRDAKLSLYPLHPDGLRIPSNMIVRCEIHGENQAI